MGIDPAYEIDVEIPPDATLYRGTSDDHFASDAIARDLPDGRIDLAFIDDVLPRGRAPRLLATGASDPDAPRRARRGTMERLLDRSTAACLRREPDVVRCRPSCGDGP